MDDAVPEKKETWYAPAERSSDEEIAAQARHFVNNPHFARLYDTIPDIVMILNQNRQVVFANAALLGLLGLQREDFRGGERPGELLDCAHVFNEGCHGCGTTEFCTTCGAVQAILGGLGGRTTAKECRITRADGDPLDLYVWASPLTENDGIYTVVVVKDISHEKRREALERVFYHDVMNVVSNILISVDLLKEPLSPADDEHLRANLLQLSARLAGEITAQRDLAAAENNELVVRPEPLSTVELLQCVIRSYDYINVTLAADKTLRIAPEAQDVTLISDRILLERVLGNMVKNALEASGAGDTVTLDCQNAGAMVKFSVHNPMFMPRHVQLQMFQRSFSTKGIGRGLGTFSIKLLSERYLGGSVSFSTSKRGGTTFTAEYPALLE